ncbi:MbtH family NRPS accessory protein [Longispora sp. NPDC051575]|uniref:MbtH family protein n=1 Tax=Longispora sp. NPDC051575 TaxID=3154943 RepID=UPI003439B2DF
MSGTRFAVVRNDEAQYSVWAEGRELPAGWHATGFSGTREECLAHIESEWTDLRPLSLRQTMAGA